MSILGDFEGVLLHFQISGGNPKATHNDQG